MSWGNASSCLTVFQPQVHERGADMELFLLLTKLLMYLFPRPKATAPHLLYIVCCASFCSYVIDGFEIAIYCTFLYIYIIRILKIHSPVLFSLHFASWSNLIYRSFWCQLRCSLTNSVPLLSCGKYIRRYWIWICCNCNCKSNRSYCQHEGNKVGKTAIANSGSYWK